MDRRAEATAGLATLWTASIATMVVAIRGGSIVLVVLALPLLAVAVRATRLQARRVRKPTAVPEATARVTRLRPRPRSVRAPRSSAA